MPAARKSRAKVTPTPVIVDDIVSSTDNVAQATTLNDVAVVSPPPAPRKRSSRKKVIPNDVLELSNINAAHDIVSMPKQVIGWIPLQDVPKTTEAMTKVKSKVEMFNKSEHTNLLKNILNRYSMRLNLNEGDDMPSPIESRRKAYDEFKKQITENQNGLFLNLTSCSNDLWQACVQCIEQMERHNADFDKLDKERQNEIAEIVNAV